MLNRFSMCGCTCEPSPRLNRPSEYACRSHPMLATVMGLRANATAMLVPSSMRVVCSAASTNGRIVVDLGSPAAVVASPFQLARGLRDVGELAGHGPVDLEADVATHDRKSYSKQFSMVNVNLPVRRSP